MYKTQLYIKKIQFSKDSDENMKAIVSKPYANVFKKTLQIAVFVDFTKTPIAKTINV